MNQNLDPMQTPECPWWIIISLRNHYRLMQDFVETGTSIGATSKIASRFFQKVWTIEIDPNMHRRAKENLRGLTNVQQYLGDSAEILPHVFPNLDPNGAMFWLDGHYSGGPKIGKTECPLLQEIEAINTRGDNFDCILIDNIGMMCRPPHKPHAPDEWPTIRQVVETLKKNPKWSVTRYADVLIATRDPLIQEYKSWPFAL
jgi:hypothetical protein